MADSFHWIEGSTVTVSATTTSSDNPLTKKPGGRHQIRVYNSGTVVVFIKKGVSTVAATATSADLPIAPGSVEVLTLNNSDKYPVTSIAVITASSTATVYITEGDGI